MLWIPIFLLFASLRLWSGYAEIELGSDSCTYLQLAKNFPFHTLYNNDLYLIHPPIFDLVLGALAKPLPLLAAGYLLSFAAAVAFFFILKYLGKTFGLGCAGITTALMYLCVSKASLIFDSQIGRTSWMLMLMGATLLFLMKEIGQSPRRFPRKTAFFLVLTLLSTDQGLLLFPCIALAYILEFRTRADWKMAALLFTVGAVAACMWPTVRWIFYNAHPAYPAGIDGLVEFVKPISWKAVLQPNYLPQTYFYRAHFTAPSFAWRNFSALRLLDVPFSVLNVSRLLTRVLFGTLLGLALWQSIVTHQLRRFTLLLGWAVILYIPCLFKMHDRYGIGYLVTFPLLLGIGVEYILFITKGSPAFFSRGVAAGCVVLSLIWIFCSPSPKAYHPYAPIGGKHFLTLRTEKSLGQHFAREILRPLAKDGIMAPVGLVPPLLFASDKRMIALPFDPSLLDALIDHFDIHYLALSDENITPSTGSSLDHVMSRDIAAAIQRNTAAFRLIQTFQEPASSVYDQHTYYLYEVASLKY